VVRRVPGKNPSMWGPAEKGAKRKGTRVKKSFVNIKTKMIRRKTLHPKTERTTSRGALIGTERREEKFWGGLSSEGKRWYICKWYIQKV